MGEGLRTMSDSLLPGVVPPIIEAIVDVDCAMPPAASPEALEAAARAALADRYPKLRLQHFQEHRIESNGQQPTLSVRRGVQALRFFQEDEKQLVQVRAQGYSFNRLAPYSSLDDYLPEIRRTWDIFVGLARPMEVRQVRLHYINRLLLPLNGSASVELVDYIATAPIRFPLEAELTFDGLLHRYAAVEAATGHRVGLTLASQPAEGDRMPMILDIEVAAEGPVDPESWPAVLGKINALRALKNRVFASTITEKCVALFPRVRP